MSAYSLDRVRAIYHGSNGNDTRALYDTLQALGPAGIIGLNLFRACKTSERAKKYIRSYSREAYERKDWSLGLLCDALDAHAIEVGVRRWGWGLDAKAVGYEHVLYIEIPTGQVSFHNSRRIKGPDYSEAWDGQRGTGADRIARWVATLLEERAAA